MKLWLFLQWIPSINIWKNLCCFVLGEKLTEDQVDELFEDCLDEEDDDGQIPYIRKFVKMYIS